MSINKLFLWANIANYVCISWKVKFFLLLNYILFYLRIDPVNVRFLKRNEKRMTLKEYFAEKKKTRKEDMAFYGVKNGFFLFLIMFGPIWYLPSRCFYFFFPCLTACVLSFICIVAIISLCCKVDIKRFYDELEYEGNIKYRNWEKRVLLFLVTEWTALCLFCH